MWITPTCSIKIKYRHRRLAYGGSPSRLFSMKCAKTVCRKDERHGELWLETNAPKMLLCDEFIFSSDEKTPCGRRDSVLRVRRTPIIRRLTQRSAKSARQNHIYVTRLFFRQTKKRPAVGATAYYRYGVLGIETNVPEQVLCDEVIFSSDEKTPCGRRDGVLQVRRASNAGRF